MSSLATHLFSNCSLCWIKPWRLLTDKTVCIALSLFLLDVCTIKSPICEEVLVFELYSISIIADLQTSKSLIRGIRNDVFGKLKKSVGFNAMIGDVLSYEQPQSYLVEDTEYTNEGTPVLTANKAFVLGYTSEIEGIYDKGDCIIFDDFTLDCKYVDFSFKVKSSAIKILTAKNKELLRYTFEFLKYLDLSTEEHKRHYITEMQNQEFILPTVQIVRTIAHAFYALSLWKETIVKQRYAFEKQKQYLLRQMFI